MSIKDDPFDTLDLSVRAYNALKNAGVTTIGDVMRHSAKSLSRIKYCGKRTIAEIQSVLERLGLSLSDTYVEQEPQSATPKATIITGRIFNVYFGSLQDQQPEEDRLEYLKRNHSCIVIAQTTEEAIAKAHEAFPGDAIEMVNLHRDLSFAGGRSSLETIVL